jgi:CheY-like chemotaxis protein
MPAINTVIRRDRIIAPARTAIAPRPGQVAAPVTNGAPAMVVVIESDAELRSEINQLLSEWGLRVIEADLDSAMPVRDEHTEAAAIIADFELGATLDRPQPFTGLDVALLIARRAARRIPTLVTSANFGRQAIPACSPHRFPVMFKPVPMEHMRGWLVAASLLADSLPWPRAAGQVRSAA